MVDLRFPGKFSTVLGWAYLQGFQSGGHHADSPHCNTRHVAGDLVTFPASLPTGNRLENLPGNRKGSPGTYNAAGLPDRRRECSPGGSGEGEYWAVAVGGVADQHGLSRGYLYALPAVVA